MINLKIVMKEFLGLKNLTKALIFGIHKLTKVMMVNKN